MSSTGPLHTAPPLLHRRDALRLLLATPALALAAPPEPAPRDRAAAISSHFPFGPVAPPRPVPAWRLRRDDGREQDAAALLRGRVSAVQFMFTRCTAVCPIEGALFAQAQQALAGTLPTVQFVSVSVDALSDTPATLAAWLRRMGAAPGWVAAVPRVDDVEAMVALFTGPQAGADDRLDSHASRVFIVDRRAELVHRTVPLPPVREIVERLREVAARPG